MTLMVAGGLTGFYSIYRYKLKLDFTNLEYKASLLICILCLVAAILVAVDLYKSNRLRMRARSIFHSKRQQQCKQEQEPASDNKS